MRHPLALAALLLATLMPLAAPAQEQTRPALSAMSEADREALRTEIRAYLLEHPEVLMEAIDVLEQRRAEGQQKADAAAVAENRDAILNDGHSWVGGNPQGDVTLVEFLDYRCGYCKKAHPELQQLIEADGNIRYIVKEFPILGPDSVTAGRMALAAAAIDPEKFGRLNDTLMRFPGQLTETAAYQIAANAGYDVAALKAKAAEAEIEARIGDNYKLARALGIEGTPGFVLGEHVLRGYHPMTDMAAMIAQARAAAK